MAFALRSLFLLCGMSGVLCGGRSLQSNVKDKSCPKGWLQLDSHCYIYQVEHRTFADAERVCQIIGGNLVSIHNKLENAIVLELVRQGGSDQVAWLGLHDAISFEEYLWTDGTVVDFTAFGIEPDGNGNCIQIFSGDGFWEDALCNEEAPYVCIRDVKFPSGYGIFDH
ncbi:lithostathine-1-alpha-like isoform X2 [Vanacampus margaritifer]